MKNLLRTLTAAMGVVIMLLALSCEKDQPADQDGTGFLVLSLEQDELTISRGRVESDGPLTVDILDSQDQLVLQFQSDDIPETIELPVGDYTVQAYSSDPQPAAFECPHYFGEADFTLSQAEVKEVTVVATLENMKVAVSYTQTVLDDFDFINTIVTNGLGELSFGPQETREGYFSVAPLTITATLQYIKSDGSTGDRQLQTVIEEVQAKDFFRIQIDAAVTTGEVSPLNIVIDDGVNVKDIILDEDDQTPVDGELAPPNSIFVSTGGLPGASGTQSDPLRDVQSALDLAVDSNVPNVVVAAGTYDGPVSLVSNVSLLGGYDPTTWRRDIQGNPTILNVNAGGVVGNTLSNAVLEGFTINSADASLAEESSFGVLLRGGDNITIKGNVINAGNGAVGPNGSFPAPSSNGINGGPGRNGCNDGGFLCSSCNRPVEGIGGQGPGGTGGRGGLPGKGNSAGTSGLFGQNVTGALGGSSGPNGSFQMDGQAGGNGQNGPDGTDGAGGLAFGDVLIYGYLVASGANGVDGGIGAGGGGGGGGGGGFDVACQSYGGSGGGGGAGGAGGLAGLGGTGGGGSFGIWISGNSVSIVIENNEINVGNGGNGGLGAMGRPGGNGGIGQDGGRGIGTTGDGGAGGSGGNGGSGGHGGGGGGGPSIGIVVSASTISEVNNTINPGAGGAGGFSSGNAGLPGEVATIKTLP
ncbi:MAG: DUF4493 domain-containing protein [Bacteroidota bacterium]